jgi:hypothetical protein
MIAAAIPATHSFSLDDLPFGWFDVAFVALIVFGLFRGRKNGMTKEVLPTCFWLATVLVCGLGCELVGRTIINFSGWDKLAAYVLGYFVLMFVLYVVYVMVKGVLLPRLTGSNFFGRAEYYLGMLSGLVRYLCILLVALALLNARFYTAEDIAKDKAYNARWYGGGLQGYSGDYFPTLQSVQESVFTKSLIGPFIKKHLSMLLINSVPVAGTDAPKPVPQSHPIIQIGK